MAKELVLNELQATEVKRLVEYLAYAHEEGRHYAGAPTIDHIFHSIRIVNDALGDEKFDLSEFDGTTPAQTQ